MSRSERLLSLVQELRSRRHPVSGATLATILGVSMRTLYRDIASLRSQGAVIEGEPGLGYILQPGFLLPPLMFSPDEVDALALGAKWVQKQGDQSLSAASKNALTKIATILPAQRDSEVKDSALFAFPDVRNTDSEIASILREALRGQRKLSLSYRDGDQKETKRKIWPVALGYFEQVQLLLAWCELRNGFRRFRLDRITDLTASTERLPRPRQALLQEWTKQSDIDGNP